MHRAVYVLLAVLGGVVGGAGDAAEAVAWWAVDDLHKVRPLDPIPSSPVTAVRLSAARNEFEPYQIVLRALTKDVANVDIEFSDLRSDSGGSISRQNIAVYFESFSDLDRASSIDGDAGQWPDALIPRIDRYVNEPRNAFPFSLRRGRNQPLWVEIFVPPSARPGIYTGSAAISVAGVARYSIPVRLTVWSFELPSTSTLRSSFGLNGVNLLKQHRGSYTNDQDLHELTRLYAKAALFHRISTHGGTMEFPKPPRSPSAMRLDWRDYDSEVGPFLNGAAISAGEPLQGAQVTSAELRRPAAFERPEDEKAYFSEWTKHFAEKGWSDRLFLYLWDEPTERDFPDIVRHGRISRTADRTLRSLVTTTYTTKLQEVVQIWTPLVNCLVSKPGFPDFCAESPSLDSYDREVRNGKSTWFYQSCASHGCNIVGGAYFSGWPSYMIDAPATANRVMQWLAWKYRMQGELYYSMNEAYGQGNDPWNNMRLFGGNGDGTLFYPGRPARIGGHTDIPVESIRLKLIRQGMEDYEYLALLAKLDCPKAADDFAARIVQQPFAWETQPEAFHKLRYELGEALNKAAVARSGPPK